MLAKDPKTFSEAAEAARFAEYSTMDSSSENDSQIFGQLAELKKDIQKIAQRYDSANTINAVLPDNRNNSPAPADARKVRFQERPNPNEYRQQPRSFSPRRQAPRPRPPTPQFRSSSPYRFGGQPRNQNFQSRFSPPYNRFSANFTPPMHSGCTPKMRQMRT